MLRSSRSFIHALLTILGPICLSVSLSAAPVDFTGNWKLDLAASEVPDDMMKAQGFSWPERQAAKSLQVIQRIIQTTNQFILRGETSIKTTVQTNRLDGTWEARRGEKGEGLRTRCYAAADGKSLITETETKLADGRAALAVFTRSLEDDGRTMIQRIDLKPAAGPGWSARRVFRRIP